MFSYPVKLYGVSIENWFGVKITIWLNRVSYTFFWHKKIYCTKRVGGQVDFQAEQTLGFFLGLAIPKTKGNSKNGANE